MRNSKRDTAKETQHCFLRAKLEMCWYILGTHWSWNSNTLAASCEELTHWKKDPDAKGLGAGREGDDRGWDGWMASLTRWTWVWVNSGSWWWTGRSGVLWLMGSQSQTQLSDNWTDLNWTFSFRFVLIGFVYVVNVHSRFDIICVLDLNLTYFEIY